MDKLKILNQIKIIKYYLIFVEINIIKWYNTEKVNMLNKEVIIVNENLDKKILGENIKKRRIELGLSQKKLASNLGISNVSLSQYETGDVNIPLATLNELANILETTVGKLLGTKEEIEYTTDRQTLLNKAIKNTNTLAIAVEKGIDKVENIFAPILKNSLDDIVILDIDGRTYEETVNHRTLEEKSLIKKIDFNWRRYDDIIFNPFVEINLLSSIEEIKDITKFLLNEEKGEKFDFLNSIIAYFYYIGRLEKKKNSRYEKWEKSLANVYNYLVDLKEDIASELLRISELDFLDYEDLNNLLANKERSSLGNNEVNLKITEYQSKLLRLAKLENKKLNNLRVELLKDLYFLNGCCEFKDKELEKQIPKKNGDYIIRDDSFYAREELSLGVFKHYDYYNDYLEYLADGGKGTPLSEKELNQPKLRKTYYFVIDKESFNDLKPIINIFFYFLEKNIKIYNLGYKSKSKKKKIEINPSKNLLVIIDRFSELNLELKDLSDVGVKQILVSDLDKIDKSYFKIENENMKATEKKMEYLYKVEEDGNIDFYKDICPVSKPKKVSIEDELRMFKNL